MHYRFPQEAVLRNGTRVLIRPFTGRDTEALWQFFQRLPPDVRRLQLWSHPVTIILMVTLLGVFWVARKVIGLI